MADRVSQYCHFAPTSFFWFAIMLAFYPRFFVNQAPDNYCAFR